jgi:hypothetical protein
MAAYEYSFHVDRKLHKFKALSGTVTHFQKREPWTENEVDVYTKLYLFQQLCMDVMLGV